MKTIVVMIIVAGIVYFPLKSVFKMFTGKSSSCGCGCSKCKVAGACHGSKEKKI